MIINKKFLDWIEKRAIRKHNWILIPDTETKYFYIDIMTYKGPKRYLKDGKTISSGDIVGELHVNNNNVPEVTMKNIKLVKAQIEKELYLLAAALKEAPFSDCKAFYGRTVLYPIVKKMGFEIFEINGFFFKRFLNFWDIVIMKVYSKSKVRSKKKRESKEIWISDTELLKKLGEVS